MEDDICPACANGRHEMPLLIGMKCGCLCHGADATPEPEGGDE